MLPKRLRESSSACARWASVNYESAQEHKTGVPKLRSSRIRVNYEYHINCEYPLCDRSRNLAGPAAYYLRNPICQWFLALGLPSII